ncbi:MAG: M28 family peptidase [Sphaerochaetaceae bacterium]|nr:M28 family peptidase [Sphaerochaetaceae bacterium]
MIKLNNFFKKEKKIKETSLTKPDLHTHRKSPLEAFKAIKLADDAISETDEMIKDFGPRCTGSDSCINCGSAIENKLKQFCDFTSTQSFNHKGLSHGLWIKLLPYVYLTTLLLLLFGFSIIPLLVNISFIYYVYSVFIIYKPIFEKNIKDTKGKNIHGVIEPDGNVTQTIIFSAHHDSAQLMNKNRGEKGYFTKVELPLLLYACSIILNLIEIFVEIFTGRLLKIGFPQLTSLLIIILLICVFPIVIKLKYYYSDKASPGAGDNLISSNILIQLAKYYDWAKKNNKGLKNTRIIFISFDAEEVGLRGSKVWFEKHEALLKNPLQLNFDCIYNSDDLVFIDSDINGLVSLDKDMANKCVKLANDMGYKATSHPLPFLSGATDAANGMNYGVKAVTLMAVDLEKGLKNTYFHTEEDTVDKIENKAVEKAISIAIKLSKVIDNNEFDDENIIQEKEDEPEEDLLEKIKFNKISRR